MKLFAKDYDRNALKGEERLLGFLLYEATYNKEKNLYVYLNLHPLHLFQQAMDSWKVIYLPLLLSVSSSF